ncbi:Uncharacterised protein [uncultured archaeon]|nr:Uncharacterised protein [uncultured archaeon]
MVTDTESFIKKSKMIFGNKFGYEHTHYANILTSITITCPRHGDFQQIPKIHLKGFGCKRCGDEYRGKLNTRSTEDFILKARAVHGNFYDYSKTVYTGHRNKISIICPTHGEFTIRAGNHLAGHGCRQCAGYKSFDTLSFVKQAKRIHGNTYNYSMVQYENSHAKVAIICSIHGVFWQQPNTHLNGCGCPICAESFGERDVSNVLRKNNIDFKRQFRIDECKHLRPLPFDFAIIFGGGVSGLIEYQGMQHYQEVGFGGSQPLLQVIQKNDQIKREFCFKQKIPFLVIPYWKKNDVDVIVGSFLAEISVR